MILNDQYNMFLTIWGHFWPICTIFDLFVTKINFSPQKHFFGPFRSLRDIGKPAMFGHFWSQKGLFGPHCAQDWRMAMAETTSN